MNNILKSIVNYGEARKFKSIVETLDIDFHFYSMKKVKKDFFNAFEITDDLIYFYPLKDEFPTCDFEFYKDGMKVLGNDKEYSEISNLDEILLHMVRIYDKSLDEGIILNPYYFMLELTENICTNYHGKAKLIITDKAIRNPYIKKGDFIEERNYFINRFLDHFIGWNFGVSVNRNDELRYELVKLNEKVIDMGIREYVGTGYEVYGTDNNICNGLQHFKLPTEKPKVKRIV